MREDRLLASAPEQLRFAANGLDGFGSVPWQFISAKRARYLTRGVPPSSQQGFSSGRTEAISLGLAGKVLVAPNSRPI